MPALRSVRILGTGMYVPPDVYTNKDLEKMMDTSDEWIVQRSGIRERRFAKPGLGVSDLAAEATQHALTAAGLKASDIDAIVFATLSPDYYFPGSGVFLQNLLGCGQIPAFDLRNQCSGFLYGLNVAKAFISSGQYDRILVVGAECHSRAINLTTAGRDVAVLFGDGAGAAVLRLAAPGEGSILATEMGTDGNLTHLLHSPGGGTACPITAANVGDHLFTLKMLGKEVFKHAVNRMKEAAEKVIERAGLTAESIACVIPHQANLRIIDAIADRLAVPNERVFVNLHKYGNTSAAAIAIALDEAHRSAAFKRGDNIVLVVFGAGLTWAAAAIRW